MSYYAQHVLIWDDMSLEEEQIHRTFADTLGGTPREWHERLNGSSDQWKKHQAEMAVISRKFPNVTFTLTIDGEDENDLRREYHQNGMVHAVEGEIFFPGFDPDRLVPPQDY